MFCLFALDHVRMLTTDEFFHRDCLVTKFLFSFMKVIASGCLERYYIGPQKQIMSAKFTSRVPWRQKLERQQEPKIMDIPVRMQARLGKGLMVIPNRSTWTL